MAESVKFKTNVPERVALKFADGLAVTSQFSGDQVMFTLTDDRKMYLPPVVADKISAAGIRAGEAFSIVKAEVKQGNRRAIEYQIETAASGAAVSPSNQLASSIPAPAVQTPMPTPSAYNGNAARAIHMVAEQPRFSAAVPAPAPAVAAPAPAADSSSVALLKMAGCGAIDAVLEMENYARSRGMVDFVFGPENLQKFASCLFIEMCKRGGRA